MCNPTLIRRSPFRDPGEKSVVLQFFVIFLDPRVLSNIFQFTSQSVFRPYVYRDIVVIKINKKKKLHGVIYQNTVIIFEY